MQIRSKPWHYGRMWLLRRKLKFLCRHMFPFCTQSVVFETATSRHTYDTISKLPALHLGNGLRKEEHAHSTRIVPGVPLWDIAGRICNGLAVQCTSKFLTAMWMKLNQIVMQVPSSSAIQVSAHTAQPHPLLIPLTVACALSAFVSYNSTSVGHLATLVFLGDAVIATWGLWTVCTSSSPCLPFS